MGSPIRVTGTYPQGVRKTYWVEFSDGFGVEVSDHHLWCVTSENLSDPIILQTLDLFRHPHNFSGKGWLTPHYQIPLVEPVQFDPQKNLLTTDYYILGMFLLSVESTQEVFSVSVSQSESQQINSKITNITDTFSWISETDNKCTLIVRQGSEVDLELRRGVVELTNVKTLRLTDAIKFASPADRLSFLQGVLDISSDIELRVSFQTQSLSNDMIELVQSLGGIATLSHSDRFELKICLPKTISPFQTLMKAQLFQNTSNSYFPIRYIQRVVPCRDTEVVCISVDSSDHLYVTEHV
jgi:hypothetical protein